MQWLISLIQEWVEAKGYLTTSWATRPIPGGYDFVKEDFTTDASWHELDLSGIIPEGTKAVSIKVFIQLASLPGFISFGPPENSNHFVTTRNNVQIAGQPLYVDNTVGVSSDRKIMYNANDTTFINLKMTVKGWWF